MRQPVPRPGGGPRMPLLAAAFAAALLPSLAEGAGDAPFRRGDASADGSIDISDPLRILFHLYAGGAAPPAPFPTRGPDPLSTGTLDCARGL